jgi:surface antigen
VGAIKVVGNSTAQCVVYTREATGKDIHGYAGNIQPTHYDPKVGDVALFTYGHVGWVTKVEGDLIVVRHSNYIKGKIVETTHSISEMRGFV